MLIFDELKKNDPQLRFVALALAVGFFVLLTGLWWVQIVSAGEYKSHLEIQSYRTVRIPAMRGKILDCKGQVLAENTARYNLSLYFDGLTGQFQNEYERLRQEEYGHPQSASSSDRPFWKFWARSAPKTMPLTKEQIEALRWQARYAVGYDVVAHMSQTIGRPLTFDSKGFGRAYESSLYVPYPIVDSLSPVELARFEENNPGGGGVDLDVQTTRIYPCGTTASHVLGYVQKDDSSAEGEDAFFNYRLPDFKGVLGIEGGYNNILHGRAGEESVMVNYQGFRQSQADDNTGSEPEPGHNVVLTIDLDIQRVAEQSLIQHQNADARGAIVVINVHTGEILAMVSSPAIDPNYFTRNLPPDQMQKESEMLDDTNLLPQLNRATQTFDAPGSIFKPIIGLAALENGLNPHEIYNVQEDPTLPDHGCIYVGKRKIKDLVPPGPYDFDSAIAHSSNSYFIYNGLRTGIEKIIAMAEKFHFGERTDLPTGQDGRGHLPTPEDIRDPAWHDGDSANICIGQGELAVTPMQMAVAYSAIANGGTVLWPQLVKRVESQDPDSGEASTDIPSGVVHDYLGVHQRSLDILRGAMLKETIEGSGKLSVVAGLQICGKTGTAQVQNQNGVLVKHNFWFASFAPYEDPKYAVVVMVEKPADYVGFGGTVCAPIAHDIYEELVKKGYLTATPQTVATVTDKKQNG